MEWWLHMRISDSLNFCLLVSLPCKGIVIPVSPSAWWGGQSHLKLTCAWESMAEPGILQTDCSCPGNSISVPTYGVGVDQDPEPVAVALLQSPSRLATHGPILTSWIVVVLCSKQLCSQALCFSFFAWEEHGISRMRGWIQCNALLFLETR